MTSIDIDRNDAIPVRARLPRGLVQEGDPLPNPLSHLRDGKPDILPHILSIRPLTQDAVAADHLQWRPVEALRGQGKRDLEPIRNDSDGHILHRGRDHELSRPGRRLNTARRQMGKDGSGNPNGEEPTHPSPTHPTSARRLLKNAHLLRLFRGRRKSFGCSLQYVNRPLTLCPFARLSLTPECAIPVPNSICLGSVSRSPYKVALHKSN